MNTTLLKFAGVPQTRQRFSAVIGPKFSIIAAKIIFVSFQTWFRASLKFFKIIFLTWNHGLSRPMSIEEEQENCTVAQH